MGEMDDAHIIRPAASEDVAAIRRLVHQVLTEHGFTPDPSGLDADIEDLFASYVEPGGAFDVLVLRTGVLLGTVGILRLSDTVCELRKMYLGPESRGRGLGHRLLVHAMDRARALGFTRMELQTDAAFDRALALYRHFGFERAGKAPDGSPCDRMLARDL